MWIRPLPLSGVNSALSTPIFKRTHSSGSTEPVETAVSGMSPSLLLRGRFRSPSGVDIHEGTLTVNTRRHRPSWTTTGTAVPEGTFASVKVPSKSVYVDTSGLPETSAPHCRHEAPAEKG